jgi:hypothetical protein
MKLIEYLLLQMELEGKERIPHDLFRNTAQDIDNFPVVLSARTFDGESLICFDEAIEGEIRDKLSKDDLQNFKTESAIEVFKILGIHAKTSHFKTYIFPEIFKSANIKTVKCFNQDDPKIIAFGFNGLADKVFAIENKEAILSACVSSRQNSKCAEAWVFTHADYRRKGLAQQVVMAWAKHMKQEGLVPFYSHNKEKKISALLAECLNLIPVFEEIVIEKVSSSYTGAPDRSIV